MIKGNAVTLGEATFDGQLSIHESESWSQGPSLLIFLFLGEGEIPDGREYLVSSTERFSGSTPHVHYRWQVEDSLETAVAVNQYEMKLTFGDRADGILPGKISFAVPGEETQVSGSFQAVLEK